METQKRRGDKKTRVRKERRKNGLVKGAIILASGMSSPSHHHLAALDLRPTHLANIYRVCTVCQVLFEQWAREFLPSQGQHALGRRQTIIKTHKKMIIVVKEIRAMEKNKARKLGWGGKEWSFMMMWESPY